MDEHLIVLVSHGDEQALALLYEQYGRLVYIIALRITQDRATAEEVVQDVFQAVWRSASSFQTGRSVGAWLMGITRHCAITTTRTANYRLYAAALALTDLPFVVGDEATDAIIMAIVIRDALDRLPGEQRQVVELVFYQGFTTRAVAMLLGEPLGIIKSRLRLGLQKMQSVLRFP